MTDSAWDGPILGIETSCDETAAAVVEGGRVLSNVVHSQFEHAEFGGVVPELASRAHLRKMLPVVRRALAEAALGPEVLTGVAATYGPGLVGALLVGLNFAKSFAMALGRPFIGVDHMEAHLFGALGGAHDDPLPAVALLVSGGHTELLHVRALGDYVLLGRTRDDAVGEAFDKVAILLGLGYPGGPAIERAASEAVDIAPMPRPWLPQSPFEFSFAGLKTAAALWAREHAQDSDRDGAGALAAGFQAACVEVLVGKTIRAVEETRAPSIIAAGGVAANRALRHALGKAVEERKLRLILPPRDLCTDNAAMVALAGAFHLARGERSPLDLDADPALMLGASQVPALASS